MKTGKDVYERESKNGFRLLGPIVRFQLKEHFLTWYRFPLVVLFFFFQVAYLGLGQELQGWILSVAYILFSLMIMQSFDQTLNNDMQDGSLYWLLSQGVPPQVYYLAKCAAFGVAILFPTVMLIGFFLSLQGSGICEVFFLSASAFLIGAQMIALSGALSISPALRQDKSPLSLPLCLMPLQIPSLLLVTGLEKEEIGMAGLLLMLGLSLFLFGIGLAAFSWILNEDKR